MWQQLIPMVLNMLSSQNKGGGGQGGGGMGGILGGMGGQEQQEKKPDPMDQLMTILGRQQNRTPVMQGNAMPMLPILGRQGGM